MKGWKNTLILVLVCVALGVYVKFFERGKVVEEGKIAVHFDPKDVVSIEFKTETLKQPITIRPDGDKWRIASPIETRGDSLAMDSILNSLKDLVSTNSLGKQTRLETYGLKQPLGTVTITLKRGKTIRLLFGKKSLDNVYVYAMQEGAPRVMVVDASVYGSLNRSLDDLRDKEVLSIKKEKVTRFAVARQLGTIELEKTGSAWNLTQPVKTAAESTEAGNLLQKITELRTDKFVDDKPANITRYALDKPSIKVDIWTGKDRPTSLFIGRKSETDKGKVFAMTSLDKPVFLLPDVILTDLGKSVKDLRQKNLLTLKEEDVTKLALTDKYGTFGLAKSGSEWSLYQPGQAKADKGTVESLLRSALDLRADDFIDHPQPLKTYGLEPAAITLSLTTRSGETKMLVGRQNANRVNAFAKLSTGETVFKVSSSITDSLNKSLNDLRDKTLVKFDRRDLKQFSIKREGKTITIERSGKDKWTITSPERAEAESSKLSTILFDLESLTGESIVTELPAHATGSLSTYGLDKPQIEVDLNIKKMKPVTILIGKRTASGNKVFLMRQGDNVIYTRSDYLLTDLAKDVKDLKK